ncbi:MAG TPA: PASTA domain-containing protein [Solirubrobacteraceae bacterium]|nr:PASTA domain-containing protein [Solirubrobacteraceae bacterium]
MTRTAVPAAAVAVALITAAPASAFDAEPMNELLLGSSQRSVAATAGPGCVFHDDAHSCSGTSEEQPLTGTLFMRPRHQIALDFDWPVQVVRVSEPRYDQPCANCFRSPPPSLFELTPIGGAPARRWVGTVPAALPHGFMRWSIAAEYDRGSRPTGNRTFEAGVYVLHRKHRRAHVPRLTGRTYGAAIRELERRGLRWRRNGGPVRFDTGAPPPPGARRDVPEGRVVAQSLRAGRAVRRATVIRLTVR